MLDERHNAPNYHIYLLRLWQEDCRSNGQNDSAEWRALLQETQSGQRVTFADVEVLIGHLRQLVARQAGELPSTSSNPVA